MKIKLLLLCLFIFHFTLDCEAKQARNVRALRVNLFCEVRSGLDKDRIILGKALRDLGCNVNEIRNFDSNDAPRADVNIFCEKVAPACYSSAPLNWFIPNPEWIWQDLKLFAPIDLILCRTREVERIFKKLGKVTYYLGFTSRNIYNPKVKKNYRSFFHLAGTSWQKGTVPILRSWKRHPVFPHLTLIYHSDLTYTIPRNVTWIHGWVPADELEEQQNKMGVHLCLSETEGFGHYLMEAMAVGAVIITTDAPPMNEFIDDPRCLVPYESTSLQGLATNFYVSHEAVSGVIKNFLDLPESQLIAMGEKNRKKYLSLTKAFEKNLSHLLQITKKQLYD